MSVFKFLSDFLLALKELSMLSLDFITGAARGIAQAFCEILCVIPLPHLFCGLVVALFVMIFAEVLDKSLKDDQKRQTQLNIKLAKQKKEQAALKHMHEEKRKAKEERLRMIRQSLSLPIGVIKQRQAIQLKKPII